MPHSPGGELVNPLLLSTPVPRATSGLAPQLDTGLTTLTAGVMDLALPPSLPAAVGRVHTWRTGASWHELWEIDDVTDVDAKAAMWLHGNAPLPTPFSPAALTADLFAKRDPAGPGRYAHLIFRYYRIPSQSNINALSEPSGQRSFWRLRSGRGAHSPSFAGKPLTETGRLLRYTQNDGATEDYIVLQSDFSAPDADIAWELEEETSTIPGSLRGFLTAERAKPGSAQWRFVPVAYTWHTFDPSL
jgi:hypothetical protein